MTSKLHGRQTRASETVRLKTSADLALKKRPLLQNEESVCAAPTHNQSVQTGAFFYSCEWSSPNSAGIMGLLFCSLDQLLYLDLTLWV